MTRIANVNLKSIALPNEHGGWSFLLEPIVLALLVAPSWQGFILGIAVTSLFLLHQPLKLTLKDYSKKRRVPRTIWAERFALLYGGLGLSLIAILISQNGFGFLLPLVWGGIFALVQVAYDYQNKSRELIPEVSGAVALATTASSMALLANWTFYPAIILWILLSIRNVTTIFYVRTRLKIIHNKSFAKSPVYVAHVIGIIITGSLVGFTSTPSISIVAVVVLLIRTIKGLEFPSENVKAKTIGITEIVIGLTYVLILAIGYRL